MNFINPVNLGKLFLSIEGNYSREVVEGEVFQEPILLKLQYFNGVNISPVEGGIIIVTIHESLNSASIDEYFGFT